MLKLLAIALAALTLTSCAWRGQATTASSATSETPQIVPVARASRANLSGGVTLTGEFLPYQEVDVMAKVAGYVRTISVDIGDRVHTGQLLATLEIPEMQNDLARASAAIEQSQAELASAHDELRRAQSVHDIAHLSYQRIEDVAKREPGLVPAQEVDEAQSKDLMTEAQVAAAKSNLDAAGLHTKVAEADKTRLTTMYAYSRITAPFDGVITKRYANVGSMIQAGTASQSQAMPVVRLSQNNLLRLILPVPESIVARVHNGEPVDVRVSAVAQTYPGRVVRFAEKVQQDTRTMDTEVDIANQDLNLVPGMYAEVNLQLAERNQVIAVPLDALDVTGGVSQVFAVDTGGIVRRTTVVTGLETDQRIEVRSGLNEGDLVIVGRHTGLRDGQHVRTKLSTVLAAVLADAGSGLGKR
jgi:RND family efflux transporter MFP subunit